MNTQHYEIRGDWFRYKDDKENFEVRVSGIIVMEITSRGLRIHTPAWNFAIETTPEQSEKIMDKITSAS